MRKERRKLKYLSDHGWKPFQYYAMNQTDVIWHFQMSDGLNRLESTLHMLEINRLEFNSLVRHCKYIEKRMKKELAIIDSRHLKEAR